MQAAVGYNFRRLIQWLRLLMLRMLIIANFAAQHFAAQLKPAWNCLLHGRLFWPSSKVV
jgi:hypothetical protein